MIEFELHWTSVVAGVVVVLGLVGGCRRLLTSDAWDLTAPIVALLWSGGGIVVGLVLLLVRAWGWIG